jgi:hypothetical protein
MKPDPKISAVPRPVRIAYLLEDGIDAHGWLDVIFADCFGRHGGRQSLIVPVVAGAISERYRNWLRHLDPDFVMLLTYDNKALVPGLVDLLADTTILDRERRRDGVEQHPRVSIEPVSLTSLSWLPFLKTVSGSLRARPQFILDRYPAWIDDGLIKDNFGTLCGSLNPFPMHQQIGVRGLILTPKDPPENRWHFRAVEVDEVQDAYIVVESMAQQSGIVTLGQLSNLHCQPHRPDHPWTKGFCVVIGDSFLDRVSCWSAGLLFDDAQNQSFKTMRVPAAVATDEAKAANLGTFLRRSNWIGEDNGPSRIVVRSHSLTHVEVQDFVARLHTTSRSHVDFSAIGAVDECCPPDITRVWSAYQVGNPEPTTAEVAVGDATTVVTVPRPMQLSYCAGLHPSFSQGSWFVDLSVDRLNDRGRIDNQREVWTLPMRPQLVGMFCQNDGARLLRRGNISVRANISTTAVEVKQPDDSDVFGSILTDRAHHPYFDLRASTIKDSAYKDFAPSDKGRFLRGMVGMFGSLPAATEVFGSHFWRTTFVKMAAPAEARSQDVIRRLKKRLTGRTGKLVVETDDDWERVGKHVLALRGLPTPRHTKTLKQLSADWEAELIAACEHFDDLKRQRDEVMTDGPHMLNRSLAHLCDVGVLHRGHEWVCRHCSHRNWAAVEALKNALPCSVCREDHSLPIDLRLEFRLNEFISTCVREHDTLSVVWALSELQRKARSSFVFAPQTALFRQYRETSRDRSDRELDIVCIVDGQLTLGEAKPSVTMIGPVEIATMAEVAQELAPNVVVLAARSGDRARLDQKVADLQSRLPAGIEAIGLLAEWDDEPSHYLPG